MGDVKLGRRGFLASLAGTVAMPNVLRGGGRPSELKLAVASDIHIAGDIEANMWEKALLAYRDWGADAAGMLETLRKTERCVTFRPSA